MLPSFISTLVCCLVPALLTSRAHLLELVCFRRWQPLAHLVCKFCKSSLETYTSLIYGIWFYFCNSLAFRLTCYFWGPRNRSSLREFYFMRNKIFRTVFLTTNPQLWAAMQQLMQNHGPDDQGARLSPAHPFLSASERKPGTLPECSHRKGVRVASGLPLDREDDVRGSPSVPQILCLDALHGLT